MGHNINRLIICTFLILGSIGAQAQAPAPGSKTALRGHIIDEQGAGVPYATVLLRQATDSMRVYGAASDNQGAFRVDAPQDDYRLQVSFVGYDNLEQPVSLSGPTDLGELTLKKGSVQIGEVVVKANMITREADRFVVNVGDSPLAIGKSALEMLALSPGVWIQENNGMVSINGKSGTQVMLNGRLLRERGAELANFLSTLKAEDIQRIEVIPITGADEDADKQGGMIKITLKRQLVDGMNGSVSMRLQTVPDYNLYRKRAGLSLNYRHKRFSSYTIGSLSLEDFLNQVKQKDQFLISGGSNNTISEIKRRNMTAGQFRLGAIYEFSDKQSVGIEAGYYSSYWPGTVTAQTIQQRTKEEDFTKINSVFTDRQQNDRVSFSGNYLNKLDSMGSTLRVLLDYDRNKRGNPQDYFSKYRGFQNFDTTYRSAINTFNQIYSAEMDFNFVLNKTTILKAGAKFTRNTMDNSILFESLYGGAWGTIDPLTSNNMFHENIGALYGAYSKTFTNQMSLDLGLRVEYTHALPWSNRVSGINAQSYFGVFPTVNFLVPLDDNKNQQLILCYARKIGRPSFNELNPFRFPISEVSFWEGNPHLQPAYMNDYSLSWVLMKKYNLTLGLTDVRNGLDGIVISDPDNPDIIISRAANIPSTISYYTAVNLPIQVNSWWHMNANLMGSYDRVYALGIQRTIKYFQGSISHNFILTKSYSFDLDGSYNSPIIRANRRTAQLYQINSSFNARLFKNKITASVYCVNIMNSGLYKAVTYDKTFTSHFSSYWNFRQVGLSIRYNFKSGKDFKVKNVESGASDERDRL